MNSEVAVVMFRDCAIPGQEEDCTGSGLTAGSIFARVFSEKPGLRAVPLSRPVAATVQFDDSAAVAYAKSKGYQYVINGDVEDYYRVAPMNDHAVEFLLLSRIDAPPMSPGEASSFVESRNSCRPLLAQLRVVALELADLGHSAIEPPGVPLAQNDEQFPGTAQCASLYKL
jgi:hypothetical protein